MDTYFEYQLKLLKLLAEHYDENAIKEFNRTSEYSEIIVENEKLYLIGDDLSTVAEADIIS